MAVISSLDPIIASGVAASRDWPMSEMTTAAPSSARRCAIASPSPLRRPDPVTTAVLPASRPVIARPFR